MSYEMTSFPSLSNDVAANRRAPRAQSRSETHADRLKLNVQHSPHNLMETEYDYLENHRSEDESRAHSHGPHRDLVHIGQCVDLGRVETHLNRAKFHFDQDNIDEGTAELIAAAKRMNKHQAMVSHAFAQAISRLTTRGNLSTPPHRRALCLIRTRKAFKL
jgi:hypothetical protein